MLYIKHVLYILSYTDWYFKGKNAFPFRSFNKSLRRSDTSFFERRRISCWYILRAAILLVSFFFAKLITTASTVIYIYSHSLKNLVSRQLLHNLTTNFRFLCHSVAESLSLFSLFNNNTIFTVNFSLLSSLLLNKFILC